MNPMDQNHPEATLDAQKIQPYVLHSEDIQKQQSSSFPTSDYGHVTWRTLISAPLTRTDSLSCGIAVCPRTKGSLHHHSHSHAEIYHVISGRGIVYIDGVDHQVSAGDVVYIPGNAEHGVRVEDELEDFVWFYCFAADRFEDVVYRFTSEQ